MSTEVTSLGYAVIGAADPGKWAEFAQSVLGLQVSGRSDGEVRLRMDDRTWRVAVEPGDDGALVALGFEVADRDRFETLKGRLAAAGVAVKESPELAAHRGVIDVFQANDPSGLPLEFFYGAHLDRSAFVSPQGARFVTGELGLGHCVILVANAQDTYDFYVDLLGFRVSDFITLGPVKLTFTSPNPRHHTLAFAQGRPGGAGLQHLMFQVDDLDTVGRALDRVYDGGAPLQSGLGRHTNDHMVSFYCVSPSGLPIEYGWGGRSIDHSVHTTGHYDAASYWGHRDANGLTGEQAAAEARRRKQQSS